MLQLQLDGTKHCRRCGQDKPAEAFCSDRTTRDGLNAYCRACRAVQQKEIQARDPETWAAARRAIARRHRRRKEYGLTDIEFEALVELHESTCCICGIGLEDDAKEHGRRLVVDHDHQTGKVRGILCHHCNVGLSRFRDDPALLVAAANYLLKQRGESDSR